MRSILLPTLGAVLSLRVLGAPVTCDTKHDPATVSSAGLLAQVTEDCIANFCATGGNQGTVTGQCGPVVLTITPLSSDVLRSDIGDCVGQFQNIIDQCLTTDGVLGGTSETEQAVYDASVNESEDGHDHHTLEARRRGRGRTRKRPASVPKTKTRTRKGKSRPKTSPKKGKKAKKPKAKKAKSCPVHKQKKEKQGPKGQSGSTGRTATGKNNVRDIENSAPLDVAKRMLNWMAGVPPPKTKKPGKGGPGGGGKTPGAKKKPAAEDCGTPYDSWYKEHTLFKRGKSKKVMWWMYRKKSGWDRNVPAKSKAHRILEVMRSNGKFDVIQIKRGHMYATGNPQGPDVHGVEYTDFMGNSGNFLITNGGFFKKTNPHKYAAVGETSTTDLTVPIPPQYADYYEKIQGGYDTFLHSGPGLLQPWTARGSDWVYNDVTKSIVGSLSHANEPNERLALAIAKNGDRYIFVYTANSRNDGLNMRGWRNMILKWLEIWLRMDTGDLEQLTNLDGGTSINVVWKANGKPAKRIAQGSIRDSLPGSKPTHTDPIKVANMLVFSTSTITGIEGGEEESGSEDEEVVAGPAGK
ncbi:hypothetical protein N0V90_013175 [Kalmusia sp. IMI 367209]|nr:hypothetical protein N0V90_013175 [Kalmusia sp. IMI 367209]